MRQVAVDVGVVELQRCDDRALGPVMEELRPLVEERGVVLVAFDRKMAARAETVIGAQIEAEAADQHAGVASGVNQYLRHHRG